MHAIRWLLFSACFVLVLSASTARAQQARVYITVDGALPTGNFLNCTFDIPSGFHTVHVVVSNSFAFRSIRFSVPLPPGCFFSPPQLLIPGSIVGDMQTDVEVDVADCVARTDQMILSILLFAPVAINDFEWSVQPAAGRTEIELEDCDGFPMKGSGEWPWWCSMLTVLGAYKPNPPDGAVDVPLDVALSFVGYRQGSTSVSVDEAPFNGPDEQHLYFCYPYGGFPRCTFPVYPTGLLPNTTYYWMARNDGFCADGCVGDSELWSFTTGAGTVPTRTSTWGAIKAMYRD